MHQPDSERTIEITIDGEQVCGTVHYGGATELSVRLDRPANDRSISLHMPNFARQAHREGFPGEYGEQRALGLLVSLYQEQKRGDRRRKFADIDFEKFGRVRYLKASPGDPARERKIRAQAPIDHSVYVQIEEDTPYGLARFFDSATNQPFLAESAVCEASIQEYIDGIKADPGFREYLKALRKKLLPMMARNARRLKSARLNPYQLALLADFGQAWRAGNIPLATVEIDQLIELGYLIRDPGLCVNERAQLQSSLDSSRKAMEELDTAGKHEQAAQCLARINRLQRRIDVKTLMITAAGKAVSRNFTLQGGD
jgi:hypothetical protein